MVMKLPVGDLKTFIARARLIQLYRDCWREVQKAPKNTRREGLMVVVGCFRTMFVGDLADYVRSQFRDADPPRTPQALQFQIDSGRQELKNFRTSLERTQHNLKYFHDVDPPKLLFHKKIIKRKTR